MTEKTLPSKSELIEYLEAKGQELPPSVFTRTGDWIANGIIGLFESIDDIIEMNKSYLEHLGLEVEVLEKGKENG